MGGGAIPRLCAIREQAEQTLGSKQHPPWPLPQLLGTENSDTLVSLKKTQKYYEYFFLISGVGIWGCLGLSSAADWFAFMR